MIILREAPALVSGICEGRLCLTSATPVPTADETAKTTVYWTPYRGNRVAVFNGSSWVLRAFAELSVGVPATTVTPYDVFVYDNAGTLALETVNWSNDTTRATALALQDGVWCKSGTLGRRWLGTGRTTGSSGQTENSLAKRFLWNHYNQIGYAMLRMDTTASWTYTTASWRQARAQAANQVEFVVGLAGTPYHIAYFVDAKGPGGCATIGIGINTVSTPTVVSERPGTWDSAGVAYRGYAALGYTYCAMMEYGYTGQTITLYGSTSVISAAGANAMTGEVWG